MKKIKLRCLMLSLFFMVSAGYGKFVPKLTQYTEQMNQCLSCTKTKYAPLTYPVYGNFVTVSGHKIWVEKYGKGSPTVILLNGGGETIRAWNKNIPVIAQYTTVIGYDRPGLGRSEMADRLPRTAKTVVAELQVVLQKIHAKPPYVLVAHSIGGLYAAYFARNYPKQVAGIVTLDGNNEYQIFWNKLNTKHLTQEEQQKISQLMDDNRIHFLEVNRQAKQLMMQKQLTPREQAILVEDLEVMGKAISAGEIEQSPELPSVPLIALTAGTGSGYDLWHASIQQFANEVPCSQFKIVPKSGHHLMIDQPGAVNKAIKTVVMAVRAHKPLCKQAKFFSRH